MEGETEMIKLICFSVGGAIAIVLSMMFGIPAFNRYQTIQDAENRIHVNEIISKQQQQLIEVEKQKAAIRIVEAEGIAASQKLINATLTDKYLQHEAIKAQMLMAGSPNHTQIYIPVGQNGIPIVKTVE